MTWGTIPASTGHNRVLGTSFQSHLRNIGRYPGRITLFRPAIQRPGIRLSHDDPTNGWGAVAEGGVEVVTVPGNHVTMIHRRLPPWSPKPCGMLAQCRAGR